MAQVTRLGLYGGPRAPYVGFAGPASAVITGTASDGMTEAEVVAGTDNLLLEDGFNLLKEDGGLLLIGGETIIITLTNETWLAAGTGPIGSIANTQSIIDGLDSAQSETFGWNAEVRDKLPISSVVRTSDTIATITLGPHPDYDITVDEIITVTVPASALTAAAELIATPTFTITADITAAGGHFIPGLAGVRAGKRKPQRALEVAEKVLDEVVSEVLDTPEKPVERVSRRLKSRIIEIATQRLLSERVLIGEVDAIDRAAARLAKFAVKRRIAARKLQLVPEVVPIIPVIPDDDQDIASLMFRLLDQPEPERDELLAQLKARQKVQKDIDDEIILLMQILLML